MGQTSCKAAYEDYYSSNNLVTKASTVLVTVGFPILVFFLLRDPKAVLNVGLVMQVAQTWKFWLITILVTPVIRYVVFRIVKSIMTLFAKPSDAFLAKCETWKAENKNTCSSKNNGECIIPSDKVEAWDKQQ